MADETPIPEKQDAQPTETPVNPDWEAIRKTFTERLFPGPTREMSPQVAKRIEGLLKPYDPDDPEDWRNKRGRSGNRNRRELPPSPAATAEDFTQLHEALSKQNELLQAILSTQVDTQTDARSTAQNSRTFAWASAAIAILTLIATVISVVAAIQGH